MKQNITLGLFLFLSLFSLNAVAQTTIFSENFSGITTGNNNTTGGSGTAWNGNSNFTVDANSKAYQAGGAVKLGTGSLVGYITTIPLDLGQSGGAFTLTFDVKGWTTVEGDIKITVTGLAQQTVTYTATMASAFETKTVNFTGGTAASTIRIETTAKRAFIDNVTVTVPETLDAPVATAATSVDTNSFTAHWDAVADATGYSLDVSLTADFATFVTGYEDLTVTGTSQLVSGLTSNTVYYYRVRAVDGTVISENSNVIDVATICGPFTFPDVSAVEYCGSATVEELPFVGGSYTWYATETGGTALDMDDALATGTYYATQTVNGCESERVSLDVTIIVVDAPEAEDMIICNSGTVADLMPNGANYKWYADDTSTTVLPATDVLESGTYYVAQVVSNCISERVPVEVTVLVVDMPDAEDMVICTSGTVADLVPNGANYKWYADETSVNALPATEALVDGAYYVSHVVGDCESDRTLVDVTITIVDAPDAEDMVICTSGTVADLTPGGTTYKWYADGVSLNVLPETDVLENGTYYVSQVIGDCESERTAVEVTIETPAAPEGASPQDFTEGETLADLDVTVEGGGDLVWYADEALTTELPATTVLTDGMTYYAVTATETCQSAFEPFTVNMTMGLSSGNMPGLVYYPNPLQDTFTVSYTGTLDSITVYNMLGQPVIINNAKAAYAELNTSGLTAGTYLVKVISGTQARSIKVVKQ